MRQNRGAHCGILGLCGLMLPAVAVQGDTVSQAQRLNNLVSQLLHVPVDGKGPQGIRFSNPREGWVHFQISAADSVQLQLNDGETQAVTIPGNGNRAGPCEAMRFLPPGHHTVFIRGATKDSALTVRAIPELICAGVPGNPAIKEFGHYDWPFFERIGLLDSINVIISTVGADHNTPWLAQGKRLIQSAKVPGRPGEAMTVEQAHRSWVDHPGLVHPQFSGIVVDEFDHRVADRFLLYAEAIGQVMKERTGRGFYPYMHGDAKLLTPLVKALRLTDCKFAYLRYQKEKPNEAQARSHIDQQLKQDLLDLDRAAPGAMQRMIVVLGLLSAPPLTLNASPAASYKVYLDMQFHTLATDPALRGIYGIEMWTTSYADEEYLRWSAKLFRHYCIEGRTERLTTDPYLLNHIANPEFEQGLDHWTIQEADPDSIDARTSDGLGWLQGRWPQDAMGDSFVWMQRSSRKPNQISQTIRRLQPGRAYSVKAFFGDYTDLREVGRDAIAVNIDGADAMAGPSFHTTFAKRPSHVSPRFGKSEGHFGFLRQVFRATSESARLTISDWTSPHDPGGPAGQELMVNFIEVEPYFEGM